MLQIGTILYLASPDPDIGTILYKVVANGLPCFDGDDDGVQFEIISSSDEGQDMLSMEYTLPNSKVGQMLIFCQKTIDKELKANHNYFHICSDEEAAQRLQLIADWNTQPEPPDHEED